MNALAHRLACGLLAGAAALSSLPLHAQEADATSCKYVKVASVPVRYTGPSLSLTMEGAIDGTPADLLVDTGAMDSALTRTGTEPRGMSLWHTGRETAGIGGYSRVFRTRFKEFRAGPVTSRNGELRVLHDFGVAPSYDGIVGAPFLLQADLEFSLAEKEIRFFRPVDCRDRFLAYWDAQAIEIPFERSFSRSPNPRFSVLLNGKKLTAIIDSGSNTTSVTLDAAKRAGLKLDAPGTQRAGEVVGIGEGRVARWTTVFDTLQLGAETIRHARVGVIDADFGDVDLLLGADFLRSHRVLFAMSQKKLYISYVGGEPLGQRQGIEAWMQQEADQGNADAQMMLSAIYRAGHGVARDPAQAQAWLERAAAAGNARANFSIGRALMGRGDYTGAQSRLRQGLEKLPGDRFATLWLYLIRLRQGEGEAAKKDLEKAFARDDNDEWPKPMARYLLGKIDDKELLEEAREDKARARNQLCNARTIMAEQAAALGETERATSLMFHRPECGPSQSAQNKAS